MLNHATIKHFNSILLILWSLSGKLRRVLSAEFRSYLIPRRLNLPVWFQVILFWRKYSSSDPCLEPIHIASVLSKFTFKPKHSGKRDSTSNDFSNDWGLSSKTKDESSAYWLTRNSEFSICTAVMFLSFSWGCRE
jgi:hypothetical protein